MAERAIGLIVTSTLLLSFLVNSHSPVCGGCHFSSSDFSSSDSIFGDVSWTMFPVYIQWFGTRVIQAFEGPDTLFIFGQPFSSSLSKANCAGRSPSTSTRTSNFQCSGCVGTSLRTGPAILGFVSPPFRIS
eukprot:m.310479 g.310479  ORF g.310479 m.310479 type:complete len:131 (-) comp16381_c0_seq1:1031-1423(-)